MGFPSAPRSFFGVHSFTPYSRTDGSFYGEVKVLKSSSLSLSGSLVALGGGSSKYSWAEEEGEIKAEMSLKFGEFPDFLFELFLGQAPTPTAAEPTGNVSTLTNKLGTSVMKATTGIASAVAKTGSETDLKFGKLTLVAASATTVDVYFSSDCDMGRGTNGAYLSDSLKVASALTITTAGVLTTIPGFGISLTGGSGSIGMTIGDTATFYTRPISKAGGMTVVIGGIVDQVFPEFGAIVMSQKRGNGEMMEIDVYRCKAAGMPLNFDAGAWAMGDAKIAVLYDPDQDGIMQIRQSRPL